MNTNTESTFSYGQGVVGDAIGHAVNRAMLSGWGRAHWNIVLEHCMVVRGWRLVRIDASTGERLEGLSPDVLHGELEPLVSAQTPPGEIVRAWRNQGGTPGTIVAISPRNARRVMLSTLAVSPETPNPELAVALDRGRQFPDAYIEPVSLDTLPTIGDGQALLIVGITGPRSGVRHYGIDLRHENGARVEAARVTFARAERIDGGLLRNTQAFLVPAGEWGVAGDSMHLNYCMGAPAFTVASGEIVFVGEFDRRVQLRPDMSDDAMRRHVPASLVDRVRSVRWENGATWGCPATNLYALEFEGFPFREGYRWASRALVN